MTTTQPSTERIEAHPVLEGYYARPEDRQNVVNTLFDDTARFYDRITGLMSLGTGLAYRKKVLRHVGVREGSRVLDLACGTGQVAAAALRLVGSTGEVLGVDPSQGMRLEAGRRRGIRVLDGKADRLPVPDAGFDFVTMGYALRHAGDLVAAFREMRRVLRPGGKVVILEITPPEGRTAHAILKCYLKRVVPLGAFVVTGNARARELMSYYWDSIERCVPPETILHALTTAGLKNAARSRTLGIFNEYVAEA